MSHPETAGAPSALPGGPVRVEPLDNDASRTSTGSVDRIRQRVAA